MKKESRSLAPSAAPSPQLSLHHCLHAPFFTTLALGLLFTAGLPPDSYAVECKFPALLGCCKAVYLWFG